MRGKESVCRCATRQTIGAFILRKPAGFAHEDAEYILTGGFPKLMLGGHAMRQLRASSAKFKLQLHLPHIVRILVILLAAVLLVGAVTLGVRGCSRRTNTVADGGIAISGANASAEYYAMQNAFVAFDGSYARAYDAQKGELMWERSPDGSQGYQCVASDTLLALYKANSIYVYDAAGNVSFSTSTEQTITGVAVGVSRVAIRYRDDSIQIIDNTGKPVETIENTEGQVMDFGLYSGSDLMWVLLLNEEGIEPKSILNIHQPGKLLIAGYSTTEQLYYKPLVSGNYVYIVGTRTIDVRNTVDMTESSVMVYGWTLKDSFAGDKLAILMTLTQQGSSATSLRVIVDGVSSDLRMHAGCTDMVLFEKCVYGFAGQTICAVPISGGKTSSYSLPYSVDEVLCKLGGGKVLLGGGGQVYLVTLP